MTDNTIAWTGFFLYARKSLPEGHKCSKGITICPSNSAIIDTVSSSEFCLDGIIQMLRYCDDALSLHKVRSKTLTFQLQLLNETIVTIRANAEETRFQVTLHVFTPVFLRTVAHKVITLHAPKHSFTIHQHFFRTWNVCERRPLSRAFKKFISYCQNWGNDMTKQHIITAYQEYVYKPPVTKVQSFTEFIHKRKGFIDIEVSRPSDKKVHGFRFTSDDNEYVLESLTYLTPVVRSVIEVCHYYQLDASFYVFRDYVYCVPQFVVANCAIPLGVIIGRGETGSLYSSLITGIYRWEEALNHKTGMHFGIMEKFKTMPYLSDNHSSLKAYGTNNKIKQYLCHRHIIESYGSNSLISICVRLLLDCYSEAEYMEQLPIANGIVQQRFTRLADRAPQTFIDGVTKYAEFSGQKLTLDNGSITFTRLPNYIKQIEKWGLWFRKGISSCSNHAESFHRVLNASIRTKGGKPQFYSAFTTVLDKINKKQVNWKDYAQKNLSSLFSKITRFSGDQVCVPCRYCNLGIKIRDRYQVLSPFPCKHLTKEKQKEMFDVFMAEVRTKLRFISLESDEEKLPRLFQMREVITSKTTKEAEPSPPQNAEVEKHDETGNRLLTHNERLIERIASSCHAQFKKKISFHWTLVWSKEAIEARFPQNIDDVPAAYELAIHAIEEHLKSREIHVSHK